MIVINTCMDRKRLWTISLVIGLSLLMGTSCKKFVQVSPPQSELTNSNTFSNDATANAAMLAIFSKVVNESTLPYSIALFTGLSSDEFTNYASTSDQIEFYKNSLTPQNSYIRSQFWSAFYNLTYQSNAIIENVTESETLSAGLKKQLIGEAKFIRAFSHFYLTNLFGEIPYITSTDYQINAIAAKRSVNEIYQQIIDDLISAESLLNVEYIGANGIGQSDERVRPNKSAASALLSRVYLYVGDWMNAEVKATEVISSDLYSLNIDLNAVFLKNSLETIWALQPVGTNGINTPEGAGFILLETPEDFSLFRSVTISDTLLHSLDSIDLRKTNWLGNVSTWYFPNKYKINQGSDVIEYSIVLRLAEQYLIRAEARAQQNKLFEAEEDLNSIRNRAGLPSLAGSDKPTLMAAIIKERQVELFSEWGHRWLDLKRTKTIDNVMGLITPQKGGLWDNYKQLYPIPKIELDNNPYLTQNSGY